MAAMTMLTRLGIFPSAVHPPASNVSRAGRRRNRYQLRQNKEHSVCSLPPARTKKFKPQASYDRQFPLVRVSFVGTNNRFPSLPII